MSKITLEDINTWLELFDFDIPLALDLSEEGNFDLYSWENDILTPKFNFEDAYFTADDNVEVVFNNDNTISLVGYDTNYLFYLFPALSQDENRTGKLCYFNPISNINRLCFAEDTLTNQRCYINYLGNVALNINGNAPLKDSEGWFVPLNVVFDEEIVCNVEGSKSFTPKVSEIYEPPSIEVINSLYIGNTNKFNDIIDCDVEYMVYYNNKPITELYIPNDTNKKNLRVKIITKSEYPYIPTEKWLTIPIEYKIYSELSDLENYNYLKLDKDISNQTWNINNKVTLISENNILNNVKIINNGSLTFENVGMENCNIINNNVLTILNSTNNELYIVNNDYLRINNCTLTTPTLINNDSMTISENVITNMNKTEDLPVIHSATDDYNIFENTIDMTDYYTNSSIMFIRVQTQDNSLLKQNTFNYNAILASNEKEYAITGNGFVYGLIDDDNLYVSGLELIEHV